MFKNRDFFLLEYSYKMKILAFADVHGEIGSIKGLVEKAQKHKVSLLVCAGDLTFFGSNPDSLLKKLDIGLPLIIIPGNHELPEDIKNAAKKFKFIKNLHNSVMGIDGCIFTGLGGSKITPFSTPFEMGDIEIEKKLSKLKQIKAKKAVLVVHEPPFNTLLDRIDGIHLGSKAIRNFIESSQPDFCVCGHFHENFGMQDNVRRTTIINPGPKGVIIEI